jgi:hypothetical protein
MDIEQTAAFTTGTPPQWTRDEQSILDFVARSHGEAWVDRHAELILEQARAIGEI